MLAIKVLLDHVQDLDRAHEYASKVHVLALCSALLCRNQAQLAGLL